MRGTAAAASAVMLAASMAVASPAEAAPAEVVTYSIQKAGKVKTGLDRFARKVQMTLSHERGWSLRGRIDFRRVSSGGEMRLVLASPEAVADAAPGCSAAWSCRVGQRVLINDRRWRNATESWGLSVRAYQHYVVNHEVGHFLGLGHRDCAGPDAPAPVMQQQSKDKEGCRSNVWPHLSELKAAARNQGVAVPERSPKPASNDSRASSSPADKGNRPQVRQRRLSSAQKPTVGSSLPTPGSTPVQAEAPGPSSGAHPQDTAVQSARHTLPVVLAALLAILAVAGAVGGVTISVARRPAAGRRASGRRSGGRRRSENRKGSGRGISGRGVGDRAASRRATGGGAASE